MKQFDVEVYETPSGDAPSQDWLDGIRTAETRTRIIARIRRAALDNFGDWKPLTGAAGIREMRIQRGRDIEFTTRL